MKKNISLTIAVLSVLALIFALAFPAQNQVVAQEIDPDPSSIMDLVNAPVEMAAPWALDFAFQGRLTTNTGVPVNGTRSITLRLYNAPSGGTALCEDEDVVQVVNGLWDFVMDFCTTADITGQQLYLGVQIGGEAAEMSPRQPIRPSPIAATLIDGANIGSIKSSALTHIYVSPLKAISVGAVNTNFSYLSDGYLRIQGESIGTVYLHIPVDMPGQLYGTNLKFNDLKVCYDLSSANSYISGTYLRILNDNFTFVDAVTDSVDRTSINPACYIINDGTFENIDGSVMIRFMLVFNNIGDFINIGNIRITLKQ